MSYTNCIVPGDNSRIVPEPKDTGPPEGFIDNTVYRYKMINGEKVLIGTQAPFPEGSNGFNSNIKCRYEDIESEKGEDNMPKKVKMEAPANLEQVWIDSNYKIDKVAKNFGVAWAVARRWLQEAELIDAFGTRKMQTSDPAQAATKEPDQSDMSADTNIPEKEITVKDVLLYEVEQADDFFCDKCGFFRPQCECNQPTQYNLDHIDGFTADDDEPIPYTVAPAFDLDSFKLELIDAIRERADLCEAPAKVTLAIIGLILDAEVSTDD